MNSKGRSVSIGKYLSVRMSAAVIYCSLVFADDIQRYEVQSGMVKFVATTNLSAISVHGQSTQMTAELDIRPAGTQVEVASVRARLDPQTLSTGMSMRDNHMRSKIFTGSQNDVPPLLFSAAKATCPALEAGKESTCALAGQLSLRGVAKPFTINLKIRGDAKGGYRASGESALKLSDFGIEGPCQLGVCVKDEVTLRFDFQARERMDLRSGGLR